MQVSMKRLLQGAIDYAGLFPPTAMSMADSVARFSNALAQPEEWIVSRFVCPASRLEELANCIDNLPGAPYFGVSAVGTANQNQDEWESALAADALSLNAFDRRMGERAAIEGYEIRVPDNASIARCAKDLGGFSEADLFVELHWGNGMADALAVLAETEWLGTKARTGGLDAKAIPSSRALAEFIRSCVDLELPFKLTAGLHHAFPTHDAGLGATTHGFVNAIGATTLALCEDMSVRELERLLNDSDPSAWRFDAKGLNYRGHTANLDGIDEARDLFISFGSCSIDEPLADLARS